MPPLNRWHWKAQDSNSKVTAQEQKSAGLKIMRFHRRFSQAAILWLTEIMVSHTWNWKLFPPLASMDLHAKKKNIFQLNVSINIHHSMKEILRLSAVFCQCCSRSARTHQQNGSVAGLLAVSWLVCREGRVVRTGRGGNIPCGSTAWHRAQSKEVKSAKHAWLRAIDELRFTSLFVLSRLQTILAVYPVP